MNLSLCILGQIRGNANYQLVDLGTKMAALSFVFWSLICVIDRGTLKHQLVFCYREKKNVALGIPEQKEKYCNMSEFSL